MFIVYIYDIKAKNKREFNRIKRRFYYQIKNLNLSKCVWKTKSVLFTPPETEEIFDRFFLKFGVNIEVYKLKTKFIEELGKQGDPKTRGTNLK